MRAKVFATVALILSMDHGILVDKQFVYKPAPVIGASALFGNFCQQLALATPLLAVAATGALYTSPTNSGMERATSPTSGSVSSQPPKDVWLRTLLQLPRHSHPSTSQLTGLVKPERASSSALRAVSVPDDGFLSKPASVG